MLSLFFIDEVAKLPRLRPRGRSAICPLRRSTPRSSTDSRRAGNRCRIRGIPGVSSPRRRACRARGLLLDRQEDQACGRRAITRQVTKRANPKTSTPTDLILKDKGRLLSLAGACCFIFSHSALREGWDNPNVFVMGHAQVHGDNTVFTATRDRPRPAFVRRPTWRTYGQSCHGARHQRVDGRHRRVLPTSGRRTTKGNPRLRWLRGHARQA